MKVVSADETGHYVWGDHCDGWRLLASGTLSVIQERVPPGCAETRHMHARAEQFFFMLAGTAVLEVDGSALALGPHQGVHVPAGIPHQFRNEGTADAVFLVVSAPPGHGDRIPA